MLFNFVIRGLKALGKVLLRVRQSVSVAHQFIVADAVRIVASGPIPAVAKRSMGEHQGSEIRVHKLHQFLAISRCPRHPTRAVSHKHPNLLTNAPNKSTSVKWGAITAGERGMLDGPRSHSVVVSKKWTLAGQVGSHPHLKTLTHG